MKTTKPNQSNNKDLALVRQSRAKKTAEVFTPPKLVNEMLDKLLEYGAQKLTNKNSLSNTKPPNHPEATFLDPACGNGNILVESLKRKISLGHDPTIALSTIYGCDIMRDNIRACRLRLLKVIQDTGTPITRDHVKTVSNQIVLTSLDRYEGGALGYDFSFTNKASGKDIDTWINGIENLTWLENPEATTQSLSNVDDEMEDAEELSIFDS